MNDAANSETLAQAVSAAELEGAADEVEGAAVVEITVLEVAGGARLDVDKHVDLHIYQRTSSRSGNLSQQKTKAYHPSCALLSLCRFTSLGAALTNAAQAAATNRPRIIEEMDARFTNNRREVRDEVETKII